MQKKLLNLMKIRDLMLMKKKKLRTRSLGVKRRMLKTTRTLLQKKKIKIA